LEERQKLPVKAVVREHELGIEQTGEDLIINFKQVERDVF